MLLIKYFPSWLRPNHITMIRLLLLAPIVYCFFQKNFIFMIVIFILAVITDLFDGELARQRNHQTVLGSFLDPIADRLLFFIPLFLLAYYQINKTVLLFSLISEIALIILALFYVLLLKYIKLKHLHGANIFGKLKAAAQVIAVIFLFLHLFFPHAFIAQISEWLIIASIIFLYLSFFKHLFYYALTASNRILR